MTTPVPAKVGKVYDIPSVSFRIITDDKSLLGPAGVHSDQARSYGYNDFSDFERPEHYIRYIEPIESELAVQVEYDMDEQDQEWLDVVNAERKKDQSPPVSYEMFEIIMDKLEKEWFNLIKRIPQPISHMPVEDSKCAICDDGEGENSNAIVFCDGCNLAVHQDCYGVPYIPEGQWLCRKCTVSPENPVSCLFCPNEGGAFKQTTTGHWSHLLCAIWIPELSVGNAVYMEPVEGVEMVPKNRWKLICSLCKERVGACIQCENKSCFTAFHVTCARQMGLLMSMKLMGADGQLRAYCDKHLPAEWRENRDEDTDDNDDDYHESETDDDFSAAEQTPVPKKRPRKNSTTMKTVTPKTARAHTKSYRPGPPIVPRMIVNKLLDYVAKVSFRKKQQFVERLCRYWSLKREARRGAPLLKRLHLEPWTATSESREQTEAEKAKKLEFLVALRNDLEKVRLLAELVRKREKEKLRQALVIQEVIDNFIFPHYITLREVLAKVVAMDKSELFLHPVSKEDVPDYYDVIKEPMTWTQIEEKLDQMAYLSTAAFKYDVHLVLDNAMVYNKSETSFHRAASRIKKNAQPVLEELDLIREQAMLMPDATLGEQGLVQPEEPVVGDLEPSLLRLQALLAPDRSEPSRDILASIFTFEAGPPGATPPRRRSGPPKEKVAPGIRDPTRSTRSAPVAVVEMSDMSSPAASGTAEAGPSRQRTTRTGPADDTPVSVPSLPPTPLATDKDLERQKILEARREREKEQREIRKEAERARKRAKEAEKERKRLKERERRRLKKEAAARERGELPPLEAEAPSTEVKTEEAPPVAPGGEKPTEEAEEEAEKAEEAEEAAESKEDAEEAAPAEDDAAAPAVEKDDGAAAEADDKMDVDLPEQPAEPPAAAVKSEEPETDAVIEEPTSPEKDAQQEPEEKAESTEEAAPPEAATGTTADAQELEAEQAGEPSASERPPSSDHLAPPTDGHAAHASSDDHLTPPSSPGFIKPKAKPERGVLGVQSVAVLSDRERREQERQLDLVTTSVDPLDEYKRFNVGWILPEGSKRKRVAPLPIPIPAPPQRRAGRSSKTPSLSDSVSVKSASDRRSDRKGKGRASTPPEDPFPASASAAGSASGSVSGSISASRKRKLDEPSSPLSGVDEDLSPIPESAQPSADKETFPDMMRSSLSPPPEDTPRKKRPMRLAAVTGNTFPPGSQVWAKVPSYPYFPAVIVNPIKDWDQVPQTVLALEEEEKAKAPGGQVWLARFYDKTQSWGWVPLDKLHALGEDQALDNQFLAGKERVGSKSVFRSTHVKNSCRAAYKSAREAMEAAKPK